MSPAAISGVASAPFLLIATGTALLLRVERLRHCRAQILTVGSLAFAISVTASRLDAACLFAMASSGWFFVKAVSACKKGLLLAATIAAIVAEFVLTRELVPGVAWLPGVALGRTIGLSYVMFRIIHLIIDAHGDEAPGGTGLRDYVCYLCFFPTFLAGPIQRIQDFTVELARLAPIGPLPRPALHQIIVGYFKFVVLAGLLFAGFRWGEEVTPSVDPTRRAAAFVLFAAFLYASFSGYTDVVRGFAGLFDFHLPENFDRPYRSSNFLDLWSRWHISLSDWFKLYLFNPLTKELIGAVSRPRLVPLLGAAGFFVTFLIMGLWHGTNLRFAFYGLCLGAGVSGNKLYQTAMQRARGRPGYARLARRPAYVAVSRGLAVTYFVLALGFFWLPRAPAPSAIGAWSASAGLVFVIMLGLSAAGASIGERMTAPSRVPQWLLPSAELAAIVAYLAILHGAAPPLIYEFF
ncbi:MAG TPA: MBOAT family O-acyltransferase [Stellaceae bacterium]|jgi:D-alanyl-lipoteichoic acid acyltransferase DltB (MBOAT superfamily)